MDEKAKDYEEVYGKDKHQPAEDAPCDRAEKTIAYGCFPVDRKCYSLEVECMALAEAQRQLIKLLRLHRAPRAWEVRRGGAGPGEASAADAALWPLVEWPRWRGRVWKAEQRRRHVWGGRCGRRERGVAA